MHPALILIPAVGLIIGPRLWVRRVLRRHDDADDCEDSAGEVARELLDRHGLYAVRVEATDGADHYDPRARAVRLSRHNIDRKSLAAVTTAAHEVAHALQHGTGYAPFAWRIRLARVAQATGQVGAVLLIALPVTFLVTRQALPRAAVGGAALAMLGTNLAAQLAALPTEMDASFRRALPMLRAGYIRDDQVGAAHRILYACSLTYLAASFAGALHIWPWLGGVRVGLVGERRSAAPRDAGRPADRTSPRPLHRSSTRPAARRRKDLEPTLRKLAKPLIKKLLRTFAHAEHRTARVVCQARGDRAQ